jgi:hypothetical protein
MIILKFYKNEIHSIWNNFNYNKLNIDYNAFDLTKISLTSKNGIKKLKTDF